MFRVLIPITYSCAHHKIILINYCFERDFKSVVRALFTYFFTSQGIFCVSDVASRRHRVSPTPVKFLRVPLNTTTTTVVPKRVVESRLFRASRIFLLVDCERRECRI